jgi:site-specific DNA-methyltransferase (adenine-specific)
MNYGQGLFNLDCLKAIKQISDDYYDVAIVDPPYGINCIKKNGCIGGGNRAKAKNYGYKTWDSAIPQKEYFEELKRVSKHQIIFGGNYFLDYLGSAKCFIAWNKGRKGLNFADGELAWTSFDSPTRFFKYIWDGFRQENQRFKEDRIHPTQKPIALYRWILENYTNKNDKILDTHAGSCSLWIACIEYDRQYTGFEVDIEYYENALERVNKFTKKWEIDEKL